MVINAKHMLTAVDGNEKWVTAIITEKKFFPYVPLGVFFWFFKIKIEHNRMKE